MNGKGKITLPDGTTIKGDFEEGELKEKGKMIFSDGESVNFKYKDGETEYTKTISGNVEQQFRKLKKKCDDSRPIKNLKQFHSKKR